VSALASGKGWPTSAVRHHSEPALCPDAVRASGLRGTWKLCPHTVEDRQTIRLELDQRPIKQSLKRCTLSWPT
jgi:hypothetical protein